MISVKTSKPSWNRRFIARCFRRLAYRARLKTISSLLKAENWLLWAWADPDPENPPIFSWLTIPIEMTRTQIAQVIAKKSGNGLILLCSRAAMTRPQSLLCILDGTKMTLSDVSAILAIPSAMDSIEDSKNDGRISIFRPWSKTTASQPHLA